MKNCLISKEILPSRGSSHVGFVDMGFSWGDHERDRDYRRVSLPFGWDVRSVEPGKWNVVDGGGFVRAIVLIPPPEIGKPSIVPIKRFSFGSIVSGLLHVGIAMDNGNVVYRTKPQKTSGEAIDMAKTWLNTNKPGWDSFTSEINFK